MLLTARDARERTEKLNRDEKFYTDVSMNEAIRKNLIVGFVVLTKAIPEDLEKQLLHLGYKIDKDILSW